jgi:2-polyprenyl-6-hydroxyphenyl methylase / 3-demethylubiquinone-9 3-methyltransferase
VIGAEDIAQLLPKGTHDYDRFIKPSELAAFIRATDLHTVEIKGLTYHPLGRRFALSNDTDINYLVACRRAA